MRLPPRLFLLVAVATAASSTDSIAAPQEPALQVDWLESPINGHWYGAGYSVSSWTQGEALAISLGGHLATVRSQAEQDWLAASLAQYSLGWGLWLGLNDVAVEGDYEWSSGSTSTFTNWASSQPNNNGNQDYVHLVGPSVPGADQWAWNDTLDISGSAPIRPLIEVTTKPDTGWSWPQVYTQGGPGDPTSPSTGDFNLDGHLDVVVGIYGDPSGVNLHLGSAEGQLGPPTFYSSGRRNSPYQEVADVTGDSIPDVVMVHKEGASIGYLPGDGLGGLGSYVEIAPIRSNGLAVVDLDNDGLLDLVVGSDQNLNPGRVWTFKNAGGGIFEPAVTVATTGWKPYVIQPGDLNNDGFMDAVVAVWFGEQLIVLLNDGTGTLSPLAPLSSPRPLGLTIADFDADGFQDVVTVSSSAQSITMWSGDGTGALSPGTTIPTPGSRGQVAAADLTNDGTLDLLVGASWTGSSRATVIKNDGGFGGEVSYFTNQREGGVGIADLDADGSNDLLLISRLDRRLDVHLNNTAPDCNGNGVPDVQDIAGGFSADCNGNGIPDECDLLTELDCNGNGILDSCEIAYGSALDCNANGIPDSCETGSNPPFATPSTVTDAANQAPWFVATTDVELDGDLDLVICNRAAGTLRAFTNDGTGSFGPGSTINGDAAGVFSVAVGDVDADGDEDLLHANSASDTLSLVLNDGGIYTTAQVIASGVDGARSVRLADLDDDGDLDALSGSFNDDTVAWYANDGLGLFGARQVISSTADFVVSVAAADLDGDGDTDVVAACEQGDTILVFENGGGGTAWATHTIATLDGPNFVRIADLDGDSNLDVGFTSAATDSVGWIRNTGNALLFEAPDILSSDLERASSVEFGDLDRDGDLDVIATGYGANVSQGAPASGQVMWFENSGSSAFAAGIAVAEGLNRAAHSIPGDFDGDLFEDLAVVCWAADQVFTQRNLLFTPPAQDCDGNGVPDECDIAAGAADCNADGTPDACQIAADATLDLNANGTLDACEAIGTTYCSPAVANSTGLPGVVTILGSDTVFLNDFKVSARQLPTSAFGYFIASTTPGSVFPVSNSVGTLCVIGSVGRGVGGGIVNSGPDGFFYGSVNLNAMPQPVGTVMVQPGDTWHFQAWHRDASGGQTTSNFTDAVSVTFQ